MNGRQTAHGFDFGAAKVTCMCSDDKKGWVLIGIETPKQRLQVYVTRTGKVRIHDKDAAEWKPANPRRAA